MIDSLVINHYICKQYIIINLVKYFMLRLAPSYLKHLAFASRTALPRIFTPKCSLAPSYSFSTNKPQTPFTAQADLESLSTNQHISKNIGLNRFMQRVYNTTGLSILAALGTSYALLALPISAAGLTACATGGFIASLVGIIGSSFMKPEVLIVSEQLNPKEKIEILVSRNSMMRKVLYGMGVVGLGMTGAPMIALATAVSPTILPTALGLTIAIFGGASLAAYRMPKDSMLSYGRVLGGSLFGLIGLQLVGLGAMFFVGPNPFSMLLLNSSSYIAVGLFTAFIAYDTHVAIKMYEENQPDHLGVATSFLLDFWNILTSLLRIFSSDS